MATEKEKTLEMRVAELEEKLAKVQISEEEFKTFQKVATTLASSGPSALAQLPSAAAMPQWYWYQWYYIHVYYWYWLQQNPGMQGPVIQPPSFGGLGR
jgi:hypothetical protein